MRKIKDKKKIKKQKLTIKAKWFLSVSVRKHLVSGGQAF